MGLVKVEHLSKIYHSLDGETLALKDINFSINNGEIVSIVGPSGCGKSTILSILANLIDKSSGEVIFDKNISLAYMLQDDCLLPFKTIYENCLIGLDIKNMLTEKNKNYVLELLNNYGLGEFIDKYPSCLSGGMRQRVALIRTLAIRPDLLLLDEATSALDYQSKLIIEEDISKIIRKEKITALIVTHDINQAISMSDKVIVLSNRPACVKNVYDIKLTNKSTPINNRKCVEFNDYFDLIWRDLDEKL